MYGRILRLGIFLFLCLGIHQAKAQVFPPDLLCLSGDTLNWELPTNNCGPFQAYEIYWSTDPAGPYDLLVSITDPAQVFFEHPNPTNEIRYYYMQSDYDCPGEPVLQSDTLDNLLPETAPLQSVSVINGEVQVSWTPSPSPEVFAYIIYRLIGGNVDPIDTVFTGSTYLDDTADPGGRSEQYYVLALDPCGNTSIFLNPHQTIFAEAEYDSCARTIDLSWNLYENWPGGIQEHEIWVSQDGAPAQLAGTVGGGATEYTYNIPVDNTEYCVYVQAVEGGTGTGARSNEVCIDAEIVVPIDEIRMQNATWTPDGNVAVSWSWNADAEIANYTATRLLEGDDQVVIFDTESPNLPLDPLVQSLDIGPPAGPLTYSVVTNDFCSVSAMSDTIRPVFLSGQALSNQVNRLRWDPLMLAGKNTLGFDLYRVVDNFPTLIAQPEAGELEFEDLLDANQPGQSNACYYVIERAEVEQSDGSFTTIQARSNLVCIEQFANLLVPNAFAPYGENQEFRPVVVFGGTADYQMLIYNRYGQLIFETRDVNEGWDGEYNGRDMPQGAYVYYIRLTQPDGSLLEKKGTVVLLR